MSKNGSFGSRNQADGYRLAFGVDAKDLSNGDIGGPEAQVTVKFGSF